MGDTALISGTALTSPAPENRQQELRECNVMAEQTNEAVRPGAAGETAVQTTPYIYLYPSAFCVLAVGRTALMAVTALSSPAPTNKINAKIIFMST